MLEPLINSETIGLLEQVAAFGERRHEVLAGNIANIDTVDYRTRDLPVEAFQHALKEAVAARTRSTPAAGAASLSSQRPTSIPVRSLKELFPHKLFQPVESPPNNLTFHDGNNRSIEHEVMELTKNSMMQRFAVELMTSQMNLLQSVISERT